MKKGVLKESKVTDDIKRIKAGEASELGVQDFFTNRDKSRRKTAGLVEDSSRLLEDEGKIKEDLYNKSLETNKLPDHIVPMFSGVFLTARRNKTKENGMFVPTASFGRGSETDMNQDFSEKQVVLSCGGHAQQLAPGMEVVLNMNNFKKKLEKTLADKIGKEFEYILPIEVIEGVEYLYVGERDVKYISNTNGIKRN
jgi:hypothetical protein